MLAWVHLKINRSCHQWCQRLALSACFIAHPAFLDAQDMIPPIVALTNPVNGVYSQGALAGTAFDNMTVIAVHLSIKRESDTFYWDGQAWVMPQTWLHADVLQGSWQYGVLPPLVDGSSYTVVARAEDDSGNLSAPSTGLFTYDGLPPGTVTLSAVTGLVSPEMKLSWTAPGDNGNSGVLNNSKFLIQYSSSDAITWSTASAQVSIPINGGLPGSPQAYTLSGLLPNTSYHFRLWTQDDSGNTSEPSAPVAEATLATLLSGDFIYALRGTGHGGLYRYSLKDSNWTVVSNSYNSTAGAALTYPGSGDYIYMVDGSYSTKLSRYNINSGEWNELSPAPGSIYYGGTMVHPGSGDFIYVFQGNGTSTFWRFSISGNYWETLCNAPGIIGHGSALVYPGNGDYIYAFQGGSSSFWRYSISGNYWTALTNAPATVSKGGALTYPGKGNYIYAFRGNLTRSFWRYSLATNSWSALADASSQIYDGAKLTSLGLGDYIYGTVGGNNLGFVRYSIPDNSWKTVGSLDVGEGGALLYPGPGVKLRGVFSSSVTAAWRALPAGPSSATSSGYVFEASTLQDFSGVIHTTSTNSTEVSSLTLVGLTPNVTYYFRIGTLNLTNKPNYAAIGTHNFPNYTLQAPTTVSLDAIGVDRIEASAYAPSPAIRGTIFGETGVAISKDGVYSPWRKGGNWAVKASMPTGRYGMGLAAVGNKIYAIGGQNDSVALNLNEEYDPELDVWTSKAPMPTPRRFAAVATAGGKIYVIGGYGSGSDLAITEEYDPVFDTWTTKKALPAPRRALAAASLNGKIYVVGGLRSNGTNYYIYQAETYEYDPETDNWNIRAPMPTARYGLTLSAVDGRLYAIGGGTPVSHPVPLSANEEYDPILDRWTPRAPMPTARFDAASAVVGGKVAIAGGWIGLYNLRISEQYDPGSDTWHRLVDMPTSRLSVSAAVYDGRVYVMGGTPGMGVIDRNEAYDAGVSAGFQNLSPNTRYEFRAKALDVWGDETVESPAVNAYTLAAQPLANTVAFSGVGAGMVSAHWLPNGNPFGTRYHVQLSTSTDFSRVAKSTYVYEVSAEMMGLSIGTTYYARVQALNGADIATAFRTLGSICTLSTDNMPPLADILIPAAAVAGPVTIISGRAIDDVGVSRVKITVQRHSDGAYWDGSVWGLSQSWLDTSWNDPSWEYSALPAFEELSTYTIVAKAEDTSGNWSIEYSTRQFIFHVPPPIPVVPKLSAVTIGTSSLTWSWENVSPEGYRVTSNGMADISGPLGQDILSWDETGLYANMPYTRRVVAFNESGVVVSSAVTRYTLAALPAAVLATVISSTSIGVSWDAAGNPLGTLFEIRASSAADLYVTPSAIISTHSHNGPVVFQGLFPKTTYYFHVRAFNGEGLPTAFSASASTKTFPGTPQEPHLSGEGAGVSSITWTWVEIPDVVGHRMLSVEGETLSGNIPVGAALWEESALSPNTAYTRRVAAFNESGTAVSEPVTRYTLAASPDVASATVVSSSGISISWNRGVNPVGTTFEIYISSKDAFVSEGGGLAACVSSTGTVVISGLSPKTTYYFRVRAINGDGVPSGFTSPVSAATFPAAPAVPPLSVLGVGVDSIDWGWEPVADANMYRLLSSTSGDMSGDLPSGTSSWQEKPLSANTAYTRRVGAFNESGMAISSPVTHYTLAAPPGGLSAGAVYVTSATVNWALGVNPAGTMAEVYRSTDNYSFANVFAGPELTFSDTSLGACTTYYFKVRNLNGENIATAYAGPLSVFTGAFTPLAPDGLGAVSLGGNKIAISWTPSPSPDIAKYNLYYDAGTGSPDYSVPLSVLPASATSYVTGVVVSSPAYIFALRAVNRCGVEEKNTSLLASAASVASITGVQAAIKEPHTGKRINGNRVTVIAEIVHGEEFQVRSVLFQYRPRGGLAWSSIDAANRNHPNPDLTAPYFVHWDVTALPDGDYDLRAVAEDLNGNADSAAPFVTVAVGRTHADITETLLADGNIKKEQAINNAVNSVVQSAAAEQPWITKVTVPSGAVSVATVTLSIVNNPQGAPVQTVELNPVGQATQIELSNGQHLFANDLSAEIVMTYRDEDGDGVVDGTAIKGEQLRIYSYDTADGTWKGDLECRLDREKRQVIGATRHFSYFALFAPMAAGVSGARAYPNPWKPGRGGRFDAAGVTFDGLPASSEIQIFTIAGELVRELQVTAADAGVKVWDGRNTSGNKTASGVYIVLVRSGGKKKALKLGVER